MSDRASAAAIHVLKVCRNPTNPTTLAVLYLCLLNGSGNFFKKKNNLQPFQCYQATYLLLTEQMRKFRYAISEPTLHCDPVPTQILYEGTLPLRLNVFTRIGFIWRSCRLKPSSGHFSTQVRHVPPAFHMFFQPFSRKIGL